MKHKAEDPMQKTGRTARAPAGIYNKPLNEFVIPYSDANLEKINKIANIHSGFFQNIIFYSHNYFEIRILADTFEESSAGEMETRGAESIERLFCRCMAVYNISRALDLDFIDFSTFRVMSGDTLQFPTAFPAASPAPLENLLDIFQKNRHFKNLNAKNFRDIFDRLTAKHTFDEDHTYLYRYDDFAANILNSYPLSQLTGDTNIKIKIKTARPVQKKMIEINLYNNHIRENQDIFFAHIDGAPGTGIPDQLPYRLARLLPGKPDPRPGKEDFISIINRLNLFLKESSFKSLLLMIDHIKNKEDARFVNYLLDSSGIAGIVLICFDIDDESDPGLIDFDLELNEKAGNLLEKYLRFDETDRQKKPGKEEIRLLKILGTLPSPVSRGKLPAFFSPADAAVIESLIKKNLLKIVSGEIVLAANLSALNIKITAEEKKKILEALLEKEDPDLLSVKISYFIKTGQHKKLKEILRQRLRAGTGFEVEFGGIKKACREKPGPLENDGQLVELLAGLLLEGGDPGSAKELIVNYAAARGAKRPLPLKMKLKLAHIYKLEKDYQEMARLLAEIKKETGGAVRIPTGLQDEYHYLAYVYWEIVSDFTEADGHREKIKNFLYIKRADVQLSDRYIYEGQYERARDLLEDAVEYFSHKNYLKDEIEAKNQLAKLSREKGAFEGAEKLYKNIFIKSEMKNYRLLSGFISVDLANLYLIQDAFIQAETWYKKALKIFQSQQNTNGVMLATFNLVEVNKIKGSWQETKNQLESVLAYDEERNSIAAMAVDHFNIAHLEYLRHDYTRAVKILEMAVSHFKKKNNWSGIIEAEILKFKLALLDPGGEIHLDFFRNPRRHLTLNHDQKIILAIMELVENDPGRRAGGPAAEKAARLESKTRQYEIIAALINRYKTRELLELLKALSMELSKGTKNYFYYEYYYIYFSYFLEENRIPDGEKEQFNEMYYFFLRNRREIGRPIDRYKQLLDENDLKYDIFKSAELVGDYIHWKIPGDFFNSLVAELGKISALHVDLVKLVIYEKKELLFDFSTAAAGAGGFNDLLQEIIAGAMSALQPLNLTQEDIKQRYKSSKKAFYPYKNTRVILWEISRDLFGVLLLAFLGEDYYDYDFYERHVPLLDKFASLIARYYENDFRLNQKLAFIIGESPAVGKLKSDISSVGKVDFPVLIRGESGSGKELVARALHLLSGRAKKSFVTVNAAAIPENLLEAELFGYKKGAFTGAVENKTGLIQSADGGTLFLDEIADLPLNLQAKLLRVLQENEIRRLGENKTIKVNIRFIYATNKNLEELIAHRQFREDLYFRIQGLFIDVPPLRQRLEDIPLLVEYFFEKYGFSLADKHELQRTMKHFSGRTWPGNVRELESSVKRLITYYPDFEIDDYDDSGWQGDGDPNTGLIAARDNLEKTMILQALRENDWNKVDAASALKISRQYLFRLITKHRLEDPAARGV